MHRLRESLPPCSSERVASLTDMVVESRATVVSLRELPVESYSSTTHFRTRLHAVSAQIRRAVVPRALESSGSLRSFSSAQLALQHSLSSRWSHIAALSSNENLFELSA